MSSIPRSMMERITVLPALGLAFASWAVFLGGLAALQNSCDAADRSYGTSNLGLVDGFSGYLLGCSNVYRFCKCWHHAYASTCVSGICGIWLSAILQYKSWWFIIAFEFVLVVALAATAGAGKAFSTRGAFLGLFAVATLLYILAANAFLTAESLGNYKSGDLKHRVRATTAGAIMTAISNCLLLIALGHPGAEEGEGTEKPRPATGEQIPTVIQHV